MANKPFEIQSADLVIGGVKLQAGTTGVVIPGVTQATGYSVEEVDDTADQTIVWDTGLDIYVVDNAELTRLYGDNRDSGYQAATYIVNLDGEGYIDEVSVDAGGNFGPNDKTAVEQQNLWATQQADPFGSFNISSWQLIPFRARLRAGAIETIGGGGGSANLGHLLVEPNNNLYSDDSGNFLNFDVNEGDGWMRLGTFGSNKLELITDYDGANHIWEFQTDGGLKFPDGSIQYSAPGTVSGTITRLLANGIDPATFTEMVMADYNPAVGDMTDIDVETNGVQHDSDDDYIELDMPFTVNFAGTNYGNGNPGAVYIGSNGYITFGQGTDDYGDVWSKPMLATELGGNAGPIPGLLVMGGDNSWQKVYTYLDETGGQGNRVFVVRWEGNSDNQAAYSDPSNRIFEILFYEAVSGQFDIRVIQQDGTATGGDVAGATDGTSWLAGRDVTNPFALVTGSANNKIYAGTSTVQVLANGNILLPHNNVLGSVYPITSNGVGLDLYTEGHGNQYDWVGINFSNTNWVYVEAGYAGIQADNSHWYFNLDGTTEFPHYTFPSAHGSAGQVLADNGSGVLAWTTATGGSSLPIDGPGFLVNDGAGGLSWNGRYRLVDAPTSLLGAAGDQYGDVAYNGASVYFCRAPYGGFNTTFYGGHQGGYPQVVQGDYPQPLAGWTFLFNSTIYTLDQDATEGNPGYWTLPLNNPIDVTGGETISLFPSGTPDIWVKQNWGVTASTTAGDIVFPEGGLYSIYQNSGNGFQLYYGENNGLRIDSTGVDVFTDTNGGGNHHWKFETSGALTLPGFVLASSSGSNNQVLTINNGIASWQDAQGGSGGSGGFATTSTLVNGDYSATLGSTGTLTTNASIELTRESVGWMALKTAQSNDVWGTSVAIDPSNGDIYMAGGRYDGDDIGDDTPLLVKYDKNGVEQWAKELQYDGSNFGGTSYTVEFDVANDQIILVNSNWYNSNKVMITRFDTDGAIVTSGDITDSNGNSNYPRGLAVTSSGTWVIVGEKQDDIALTTGVRVGSTGSNSSGVLVLPRTNFTESHTPSGSSNWSIRTTYNNTSFTDDFVYYVNHYYYVPTTAILSPTNGINLALEIEYNVWDGTVSYSSGMGNGSDYRVGDLVWVKGVDMGVVTTASYAPILVNGADIASVNGVTQFTTSTNLEAVMLDLESTSTVAWSYIPSDPNNNLSGNRIQIFSVQREQVTTTIASTIPIPSVNEYYLLVPKTDFPTLDTDVHIGDTVVDDGNSSNTVVVTALVVTDGADPTQWNISINSANWVVGSSISITRTTLTSNWVVKAQGDYGVTQLDNVVLFKEDNYATELVARITSVDEFNSYWVNNWSLFGRVNNPLVKLDTQGSTDYTFPYEQTISNSFLSSTDVVTFSVSAFPQSTSIDNQWTWTDGTNSGYVNLFYQEFDAGYIILLDDTGANPGYTTSTSVTFTSGEGKYQPYYSTNSDGYIVTSRGDGTKKGFGGSGNQRFNAVAISTATENLYVVGHDNNSNYTIVAKFTPDGGTCLWYNLVENSRCSEDDDAHGITVGYTGTGTEYAYAVGYDYDDNATLYKFDGLDGTVLKAALVWGSDSNNSNFRWNNSPGVQIAANGDIVVAGRGRAPNRPGNNNQIYVVRLASDMNSLVSAWEIASERGMSVSYEGDEGEGQFKLAVIDGIEYFIMGAYSYNGSHDESVTIKIPLNDFGSVSTGNYTTRDITSDVNDAGVIEYNYTDYNQETSDLVVHENNYTLNLTNNLTGLRDPYQLIDSTLINAYAGTGGAEISGVKTLAFEDGSNQTSAYSPLMGHVVDDGSQYWFNLKLDHAGKFIFCNNNIYNIYLPDDAGFAAPIGFAVTVMAPNWDVNLVPNNYNVSPTIIVAGQGANSNQYSGWKLKQYGMATIIKTAANTWWISGGTLEAQ